mmetsp:Transcript_80702/g.216312  ORF Transcript_80702/g.216312 Transcript_80702/m.216312 type:complete len:166 (-) Transcript_80702:42-539(-)
MAMTSPHSTVPSGDLSPSLGCNAMATASLRCLEMKRVPVVVAPGSSTLIRAAHGMVVRRAGTTQGGWGRRLARSRGEYEEEELSTTAGALIVGVILFVLAFALAIHHWCIHKDAPPEDGTLPFLLQPSDFMAAHCTHENWILAFVVVGSVLVIVGLVGAVQSDAV